MLAQMAELSGILRDRRHRRGSIDFDFPEAKLILDEKGRPVEIRPYERNAATRLIEDFMLLANETVAEEYFWREVPFLYRTHEAPDEDKMKTLAAFINNFGYTMHIGSQKVPPMEIQKLMGQDRGHAPGGSYQPAGPALHEAGKVHAGKYRAFWPGRQVLCPIFTSPHQAVSGSPDTPDHQG